VISSSNADRCAATAREVASKHAATVVPIVADMFEPESMDALFRQAMDALGGIDILFINHPGPALGLASEIDVNVLEQQFRMMVVSPIRLVSRVLPGMRERRWGRIVSVGGAGMVTPLANKVMDDTLRPSLAAYSKALANEVAADGVDLAVAPEHELGDEERKRQACEIGDRERAPDQSPTPMAPDRRSSRPRAARPCAVEQLELEGGGAFELGRGHRSLDPACSIRCAVST